MRKHGRTDGTQAEIVSVLRRLGATVQSLASVGNGCPDLLVGYARANYLLEVKDGNLPPSKRKLTPDEARWAETWSGDPVQLVGSAKEAAHALGITL